MLAVAVIAVVTPAQPRGASSSIVISQVYGGGGNSGAAYTHDFIELFNRGNSAVSVAGWSVQYASATGSTWQVTALSGSIPAGGYYLVQQAAGAGGTTPLPTSDATGAIPMSATAGKVALASTTTALSGTCPASAGLVDLVGFGSTASCFEGSGPTPTLSNTTAGLRGGGGCTDTDNNAGDFSVSAPAPRNSSSALNTCSGPPSLSVNDVSVTEGHSGIVMASFTVSLSAPAGVGGVTFDIATADNTATTADADYVARSLTGQTIPAGQQTYTFDVTVNGDTTIEANESFFVNVTNGTGAVLGKGQGIGTIVNDDFAPPVFNVAISQVYGGGGNSGATYIHDFVELFNRGTTPVNVAGWSVQYNSAAGTGIWQVTQLSGTIQPGRYYLVQQAAGAGGTTPLPAPDVTGSIPMASGSGKIALRASATALNGACPVDATIVDLVGFGATANCFEGAAPTPNLSNTTAALRKRGGCFDSNDNAADFLIGAPSPRNSGSPARPCDYQTLPIHAIQGSGLVSPYVGQDVFTTGVVTGVKTNGFFLQTPDGAVDDDPTTSEGLFVFTSAAPAVNIGDLVDVKGTAGEFFNLTQIEATLPGDVTVSSTHNTLPSTVILTTTVLDASGEPTQLERLEGMRVHAPALVSVGPTNQFGEIFTVLSGVARPTREPGIERGLPIPPDPVTGLADCCIPIWDRNPERIVVDTDGLAGATPIYVTSRVTLTGVTGPLDFSFSNYKVLPEAPPTVSDNMTAVAVPSPAANEFTVGSYNIENFSNNATQRQKAALHIRTVMQSPDVIGVIEISSLAALEALATQVNDDVVAAGGLNPQYAARLIPFTGTQHVGFLVKTSRVAVHVVRQERATDTFVNPNTGATEILHDRPPLVLDAMIDPAGANPARVLIVVNHLRSFIDVDLVAGEGPRVRAKRTAQAESIAGLLQELQQNNPGVLVISIGDYNAYQFSDGYTNPIAILKGLATATEELVVQGSQDLIEPDYVNLTDRLTPDQQYTFIFEGTPQALDHVLVSQTALKYFQRYAIARSNADFPDVAAAGLVGNAARPEANSDHDSPVAYFTFPGRPVVTLNGGATLTAEAFTSFVDPGATAHDDDGSLPVSVTGTVNVNVPGTYTLSYTATNAHASTTVQRIVFVNDTIAPAISGFSVSPSEYGPPNHEMFNVVATYTATDASSNVSCGLSVTSNEPANSLGDGNTEIDWIVMSPTLVQLRAERSGRGAGRIYTVMVTCSDPSGNASSTSATVTIAR